jgi:hypothetical protein
MTQGLSSTIDLAQQIYYTYLKMKRESKPVFKLLAVGVLNFVDFLSTVLNIMQMKSLFCPISHGDYRWSTCMRDKKLAKQQV